MDAEPRAMSSDSASASEYMDAEGENENNDFFCDSEGHHREDANYSIIHDIQEELGGNNAITSTSTSAKGNADAEKERKKSTTSLEVAAPSSDNVVAPTSEVALSEGVEGLAIGGAASAEDKVDYLQDETWRQQKKHIFILSDAGKPIYSLHGNEDKLANLFGVIQALVSFVQHGQDTLTSIHAHGIKFVFLVRNSLILVAASRSNMSVQQLQMQLSDVYNQIVSTITFSHMSKIFEKRKNFDLRRLLAGSERLIYHLLANDSSNKRITNNVFAFLTNSIRVLPLASSVRSTIFSAIQTNCSKNKNLVFAVLIANNKLIALVRMKKYTIHAADLRLIFNLVECSESFKSSENWTPICLPKFDMNGYLHAHVSYLADDCQACLLLLSVNREDFFELSDAKRRITEKLRRAHCLEAINDEIKRHSHSKLNLNDTVGIPQLRHFLYKPKGSSQLLCSELMAPYTSLPEFERLEAIYCNLLQRIHCTARPLKLIYEAKEHGVMLAWVTTAFELYAVFEPLVEKSDVIKYVEKLFKIIEKDYDVFFIRNHPTF